MTVNCPLCFEPARLFSRIKGKKYLFCGRCGAVFLGSQYHLPPDEEKKRYLKHNNDVNDPRYQEFVRPIVEGVLRDFGKEHIGIDFGCGPGPVISKLLGDRGYLIKQYDPFFYGRSGLLADKYDYIVCSEVVEHFREPAKEFKLLRSLLNSGGKLFCLTERYSPDIDFERWYYKNDPTHVFFYQKRTFEWIRDNFGFSLLEVKGRLAVLTT